MCRLFSDLMRQGYLKTDLIIDAFSKIDRAEFVPDEFKNRAEEDIPLPIGFGQTISQPLTVVFMLELLNPQRKQNVLDLGSGSGWTTALLSHVVGQDGKVTAIERIKELCEWGKANTDKFEFVKNGIAEFHCIDGNKGYEKNAPYDRILVSAMAEKIPNALKNQLKIGGRMVIPMRGGVWLLKKRGEKDFYAEEYPGFSFVPFIQEV